MFFLPDVASASIACFKSVSLLLSVTFTVVEDDKANKVQCILIDASGELTETLNLYCITHNTLPFITYNIYMKCIHIYSYMLVCENSTFRHMYQV